MARGWLATAFADVPDDLRHGIVVGNACRFFGCDPARALTPTPPQLNRRDTGATRLS